MIKLSKYIYIHPLTLGLFVSAYVTRTLGLISSLYLVMFVHELAHMTAALFLRLGIGKIIFYPFGVSLTLKTRILCSFSDKIILYLSGPLINAVVAVIMQVAGIHTYFCYNNLALFLLNLLPILPLDGGNLLEEVFLEKMGEKYARKLMRLISFTLLALLLVVMVIFTAPTVNTVSFAVFMIGAFALQKPKYNRDCLRLLSLSLPKTKKTRVLMTDNDASEQKIVNEFSASKRTLIIVCDNCGKIENIKTDIEIINKLLS